MASGDTFALAREPGADDNANGGALGTCADRICIAIASEITLRAFLVDQLRALSECYDVTVVVNGNNKRLLKERGIAGKLEIVPIERRVSLWQDLTAFAKLIRLFRRERFRIVHSITPKAGLLATAAGWLCGVPIRIHTFTGQVWATRRGVVRWLLRWSDRAIAAFATHVLVDSESQRQFLADNGVVTAKKARVLARGSISGVDTRRFIPDAAARRRIRDVMGIPDAAICYLFVGRINRDKGVLDLASAFADLGHEIDAHLVFVGPDEEGLRDRILHIAGMTASRVHFVDYTIEPEHYMAAADVFCLPSYREGFGTVIIEAAAVGLPAIASRIYGITDAVVDGITGLLHAPRDTRGITDAMRTLAERPDLRHEMGRSARERARREFSQEVVTEALIRFYADVTREKR